MLELLGILDRLDTTEPLDLAYPARDAGIPGRAPPKRRSLNHADAYGAPTDQKPGSISAYILTPTGAEAIGARPNSPGA